MEAELRQHIQDDREFQREITGDIKVIKENHLHHIEQSTARIETNIDWLMRFFWIIATAAIGGLVSGLLNLLNISFT